jgi:hypothetical protein
MKRELYEPSKNLPDDIKNVVAACTRITPKDRPMITQIKFQLIKLVYLRIKNLDLMALFFE